MGTPEDPVLRNVTITIRDVPIDTAIDPYQWGNGILNLGDWSSHGKPKTTWTTCASEQAGSTTIVVGSSAGWEVGDVLVITDTRQMHFPTGQRDEANKIEPYREQATIAAIDGKRITLAAPLVIAHEAITRPDGQVVGLPYVANCTRNITIKSENPNGVRGHTVTTGDGTQSLRFTAFVGLGRTLPIPLDNTRTVDGQLVIGTNQIARYSNHWHHAHALPGDMTGCYLHGSNVAKWGIVVHGTSDMTVHQNVVEEFVGSGIVTEDGPEVRNVITDNLVMFARGNTQFGRDGIRSFSANNPGGEGAGFWLHGLENTFRFNVSTNNRTGFDLFNFEPLEYLVPSEPGGTPDRRATATPLAFESNTAVANYHSGVESWQMNAEAVGLKSFRNGFSQVFAGSGRGNSLSLRKSHLLAQGGDTTGYHSSHGYTTAVEVRDSIIEGCREGLMDVRRVATYEDTTLKNLTNIDWGDSLTQQEAEELGLVITIRNVACEQLTPESICFRSLVALPEGSQLDGTGATWTPETPVMPTVDPDPDPDPHPDDCAELRAEVAALTERVAELEALLEEIRRLVN